MADDTMVFVTEDNKAVISCPECGKLKQISVDKFKAAKHTLTVRCSCKNEFLINLNFRKGIRKQVNLEGTYRQVSPHHSIIENCTVVDLSFNGIRLKLYDTQDLKIDDELIVHFVLNDKHKTDVKRKIQICELSQENTVGAKFIDTQLDNYDKHIGFYLMN
ncbi:MAG: PilZ domain-containing protein [Desulfobulbaceae bacterium]|jgi:hypothetical protein|nr:PilZ domain-containing protein [Desulfobulbaceae bacterium]